MKRQNTKELLFQSLHELMKTQSLSKITVDEISENCGFKRGTFYYYFKDKEDLVQTIIYQIVADNHHSYYGKGSWDSVLVHSLEFSNQYRRMIRDINEKYQWLLALNPMGGVIKACRASLLGHLPIDWLLLGISTAIIIILFISGLFYFKRMERTFADVV